MWEFKSVAPTFQHLWEVVLLSLKVVKVWLRPIGDWVWIVVASEACSMSVVRTTRHHWTAFRCATSLLPNQSGK